MSRIAIPIPSRTRALALILLILSVMTWIVWAAACFMSSGEAGSVREERLQAAMPWILVAALILTTLGLAVRNLAPCWIVDTRRRRLRMPGGRSLPLSAVRQVTLSSYATPFMDAGGITHEAESQYVYLHLENGDVLRSGALGGVFAQGLFARLQTVLGTADCEAEDVD